MTSRALVTRVLEQQPVPRLPRDIWTVPYIQFFRQEEFDRFLQRFPSDITGPSGFRYGMSPYEKGAAFRKGRYTDAFGTEWEVLEDGITGEVKNPLIKTRQDLDAYQLPWAMLTEADGSGQAAAYKVTDKFVLAGTQVRPFERMQFLRGTEDLFVDIAEENEMFLTLKDMLHAFNLRELRLIAAQAADGVSFMDDWGTQRSLLISPAMWRKHFKPMYKEYCDIIHQAGKFVFFHSDGFTEDIYGDLIEIGVDAFNSQLFCMDIEKIGALYAGKITFWGELDRQRILPFGTEADARAAVGRLKDALFPNGCTGMIAQLSWETVTPYENVIAAYEAFDKV